MAGAGDAVLTEALAREATSSANCIISFGIAGGLAPGLPSGSVILSGEVVGEGGHWKTAPAVLRELSTLAVNAAATQGTVLGAATILATAVQKTKAGTATAALTVDLESLAVARAASAAGIPFIVLRSVADTVDQDLPPAALISLASNGRPKILPVLAELLRRPAQLPGLLGLAGDTRRALASLVGPARALYRLALRL